MQARFSTTRTRARRLCVPGIAIGLMLIVALFAAFPSTVAAQQPPHVIFTGKGFIDDQPVANGTVVEAWIRGIPVAATEVFGSEYQLYLTEPPGESFEGEVVRFKLGGYGTDAAAGWFEGKESWILLYAYTGLQGYPDGFNGDVTGDPEPLDRNAIIQLQARLSKLERELSELAAELQRQVKIDIADVTNRWEGAITELRVQVEREIQQATSDFEFEARQILLGSRRDGSLRSLKAELDAIIQEKWAWFEVESLRRQQYLRDEIIEIEQARDRKLNAISQIIYKVESEIKSRLERSGVSFDDFQKTGIIEYPVINVAPHPFPTPDEVNDLPIPNLPTPEIPDPKEPGRNRGFFTNSISADPNGLNRALDPTTLAVIGILITLAATGVQLLKGN